MEIADNALPTLAELRAKCRADGFGSGSSAGSLLSRNSALRPCESPTRETCSSSLAFKALGVLSPVAAAQRDLSDDWRFRHSPDSELSVRSAFADTEASPSSCSNAPAPSPDAGVRQDQDPAASSIPPPKPQHARSARGPGQRDRPDAATSSAAVRSGSTHGSGQVPPTKPFLRKGSRMARSLPPDRSNRPSKLQPREAFKQAAALTATSVPQSGGQDAARSAHGVQRAKSQGSISAVGQPITPQRTHHSRPQCSITPAAVAAPRHRMYSRPSANDNASTKDAQDSQHQNSLKFSWRAPCGSPLQNGATKPDDIGVQKTPPQALHRRGRSASPSTRAFAAAAAASSTSPGPVATSVTSNSMIHAAASPESRCATRGTSPQNEASEARPSANMPVMEARPSANMPDMEAKEPQTASKDLSLEFEGAKVAETRGHLEVLDVQILQFREDNAALARLRKQNEQVQADLFRERETLKKEVAEERKALRAEVDRERQAVRRERARLEQDAERKHIEAATERLELRESRDKLREEMKSKEKTWQRTVDRLQRQVDELTRKNKDLMERSCAMPAAAECNLLASFTGPAAGDIQPEIAADEVAALPPPPGSRNGVSECHFAEVPPLPDLESPPPPDLSRAPRRATASGGNAEPEAEGGMEGIPLQDVELPVWGTAPAVSACGEGSDSEDGYHSSSVAHVVREATGPDGRLQQLFSDGREEIVFPSGLKKVLWPDSRTSVLFQNGDIKESLPDGIVVYRYQSTGAVQTTQPNGTDIFQFAGGQVEWHHQDGSKEIRFANGSRKRISADGFEEVCPLNSRGVWTPVLSA